MRASEGTLAAHLWDQASSEASMTLLGRGDKRTSRSHADLVAEALAAAGGLDELGVRPGDRVGLVAEASFATVIGLLAIWRCGATMVICPAAPRFSSSKSWARDVALRLATARASHVLTPRPGLDTGQAIPISVEQLARSSTRVEDRAALDGLATITFTSGSTGQPKAIGRTHRRFRHSLHGHARSKGCLTPGQDHRLGWAPLHQLGAAMTDVLSPMWFGVDFTLLPTELFMMQPGRWLTEISRTGATYSGGPNFAYGLAAQALAAGFDEPLDLSRWKVANCSGEFIAVETMERFAQLAEPHGFDPLALGASYGLTETGAVTSRPTRQGLKVDVVRRESAGAGVAEPADDDQGVRYVSLGSPRPGYRLRIAGPSGEDVPERVIGEVLVAGEGVMDGYLDDPEATAAAFSGEWFKTGDLGYLAEGELYITGRIKDVIIVHGRNYHATHIERAATRVPEVEDSGCAAFAVRTATSEGAVLAVEIRDSDRSRSELARAVKRHVWRATGLTPHEVVLLEPGTLPRTSAGKLQRAAARDLYEAGALGEPVTS